MPINFCEYGCGQEGVFQMSSGKWCCSKHRSSCPGMRRKNSEGLKNSTKLKNNCTKIHELKYICQYCQKSLDIMNIKKHENSCHMNPKNIRYCICCGKILKKSQMLFCSINCSNKKKEHKSRVGRILSVQEKKILSENSPPKK